MDLHGSTKPKEPTPADVENENVFDIQKGVSIALYVKRGDIEKGIWFSDVWGDRLDKYLYCSGAQIRRINWTAVQYFAPYYMFRPLNWTGWHEYEAGWSLADSLSAENDRRQVFGISVLGFQTHRDHFAIAFSRGEIEQRVQDMQDDRITDAQIESKYDIESNRDWKIPDSRKSLRDNDSWKEHVTCCALRPFDRRPCFFGHEFMDYPRRELLDHVFERENLVLLVPRQIGTANWQHAFVTAEVTESCCISDGSTEQNYCFPLFVFPKGNKRTENITPGFRAFLDVRYSHHYTPEEILGYIYAFLYAPQFRRRYAEFLRIDFPRINFPESESDFERLSELGWELVLAHLLRDFPRRSFAEFHGKGDRTVEDVSYLRAENAIRINTTQQFRPVPENVWEFHIGGHPVLEKYLKSRKDRILTLDEINHVAAVADSPAFTIEQMARIDEAYRTAFPDGG